MELTPNSDTHTPTKIRKETNLSSLSHANTQPDSHTPSQLPLLDTDNLNGRPKFCLPEVHLIHPGPGGVSPCQFYTTVTHDLGGVGLVCPCPGPAEVVGS